MSPFFRDQNIPFFKEPALLLDDLDGTRTFQVLASKQSLQLAIIRHEQEAARTMRNAPDWR